MIYTGYDDFRKTVEILLLLYYWGVILYIMAEMDALAIPNAVFSLTLISYYLIYN